MPEKTEYIMIDEHEIRSPEITDMGVKILWKDGSYFCASFDDENRIDYALAIAAKFSDKYAKLWEEKLNDRGQ